MGNPNSRAEVAGVPMSIYDESEAVTVATGSYGLGHGLSVTVHFDEAGEVPEQAIRDDAMVLLDVALKRAYKRSGLIEDPDLDTNVDGGVVLPEPVARKLYEFVAFDGALDCAPQDLLEAMQVWADAIDDDFEWVQEDDDE